MGGGSVGRWGCDQLSGERALPGRGLIGTTVDACQIAADHGGSDDSHFLP